MRITDVQTILLTGPATLDPFVSECRKRRSAAFIEIHTDSGLTGIGETYAGYFCPEIVPEIVKFFRPILCGQEVENIKELWQRMYHCGNFWCRVGLGIIVLNGIEAALWDLKGKILEQPVYRLLGGGKHERLDCYATGGPSNYPLDKLRAKVEFYLSLGFKAVKLGVGGLWDDRGFVISADRNEAAEFEAEKLAFISSAFGSGVKIMLDGHMGNSPSGVWNLETARTVMKAVQEYNLLFFEEPLPYEDSNAYAELRANSEVAIAGGECLTGQSEWRQFIEMDCFDVGQPDASFSGGLSLCLEIAGQLERRGRKIATHSWGAGASLMQNIHCGFAAANTLILEIPPAFGPLHSEIMGDSFQMEHGQILPPQTPGMGIILTDELKARFPFEPGSGEFNSVPGKIMEEELHSYEVNLS